MVIAAGCGVGTLGRRLPECLALAGARRWVLIDRPPCPGSGVLDCLLEDLVRATAVMFILGAAILGTYLAATAVGITLTALGGICLIKAGRPAPWALAAVGIGTCIATPGYCLLVVMAIALITSR